MSLVYRFFNLLNRIRPAKEVSAHCDIPCGIYDPYQAQIAVHTVIRMVNLINDLPKLTPELSPEQRREILHKLQRYIIVKEEHAEIVKKEVRIIWGDYFKPEHLKDHPELHELVFKIMKLASKARQEVNLDASKELLENVQKFAEIFWKTKGIGTMKVKAPSPSGGEVVVGK